MIKLIDILKESVNEGVSLPNRDYEKIWEKMPREFRHKIMTKIYGKEFVLNSILNSISFASIPIEGNLLSRDANKIYGHINGYIEAGKMEESINEAVRIPSNIEDFAKRKGVLRDVKQIARWVEKSGKRIVGGTAIGKGYDTLVLDLTYQGAEIYYDTYEGTIKVNNQPVTDLKSMRKAIALKESVNEAKEWSSYEQRMVNQIKVAKKEGRGMYTLPMKTQDFYRKHKDKFDESINEQMDTYDEIANAEFGMDYDQLGSNEQEWVRDEIG